MFTEAETQVIEQDIDNMEQIYNIRKELIHIKNGVFPLKDALVSFVKEENSSWKFCFIDNERTRKCHIFCNRLRLKNLVQINLLLDGTTKADRLRFFKYYLRLNPDIRRNSLKWINKVNSKTKIRMRRKSKAWSLNQNILA